MAGSSRGAFASTSSWTTRITCQSPRRVTPLRSLLLSSYAPSYTSSEDYAHHARSFHTSLSSPQPDEELSAPSRKQKTEVASTEHSPMNEVLSEELFAVQKKRKKSASASRPELITLQEFHNFRPDPNSIKIAMHFAPHVRHKLRDERLWQKTYLAVETAYNKRQLIALAEQADILPPSKSHAAMRKPQLVSLLLQHQFGMKDPDARPAPAPEPYSKFIPISTTALFLMLIDGSKVLSQISRQYGVDIRPDIRRKPGQSGPRGVTFGLQVTGSVQRVIERQVTGAVQEFVETIRSEDFPLAVPEHAIDGSVIRFISQHVGCSIHSDSRFTSFHSLTLAATDTNTIRQAKTMLSAMQARCSQSTPTLFSFAAPSPLDADYVEDSNGELTMYGFLPTIPHSALTSSLKAALGDRLSATLFRLVRARKALWSPRPRSSALQRLSLVDVNDDQQPLDTPRNSLRLDERLSPIAAPLENLPLQASAQNATSTQSLHIGNLLFPGRQSENESVSSPVLQHVFGAPLSGSWPLDTAFEWFRQRQPLVQQQAQPVWSPLHLNGSATDAISEHAAGLRMWMKQGKAQEEEKIRLVYWVAPLSWDTVKDDLVKLEIDIREVAQVNPAPELEQEQELNKGQEQDLEPEQELDLEQSASSQQGNEVDDIFGEKEPNASVRESSSLDDLFGETVTISDPSSADADTKRQFSYVVDSARWTVSRRADIFAPDHDIDFRAETNTSVPVNLEALQEMQVLKDYCSSLDELARARSVKQSTEEQEQHQAHPKTSRHPPPVNSSPPLSLDLEGLTCRFESAERIFSTRWEMDPVAGQELDKDMYGDPDEEVGNNIDTKASDDSNTSASSSAPSERAFFINETTIGVEYGQEGSRTASRIEWAGDGEKGEGDEKGLWKRRMDSVRGLFRSSLIEGAKASS